MVRLLAISGSLRLASSNTSLLQAAELLAPAGTSIAHYREIGRLPHFNPDLDGHIPDIVVALRAQIEEADGLLIACPEYARGIPGSFKNMLDWLVGSLSFPGKPVALFNASPRASAAQAALRLVLETMSARVVNDASITVQLLSKGMNADVIAADPAIAAVIVNALHTLTKVIATEAHASHFSEI